MEFANAKSRATLKFSFFKSNSARHGFSEISSVFEDDALSSGTAEEWFLRFRDSKNDTMDRLPGERPFATNSKQMMEHIE